MSEAVLKVAAKAVIINDKNEVLVLREADTYIEGTNIGKWGIPGGRLTVGESFEDGLRREVSEETGLTVTIGHPLYVGEWRPVIKGIPHQIIAIFVICHTENNEVVVSDEHDMYQWVNEVSVSSLNLMPPDDSVIARYFGQL